MNATKIEDRIDSIRVYMHTKVDFLFWLLHNDTHIKVPKVCDIN